MSAAGIEDYTDQTVLDNTGEDFPIESESENYGTGGGGSFTPTLPGTYTNSKRELDPRGGAPIQRERDGKAVGVLFRLTGGLTDAGGKTTDIPNDKFRGQTIYASTRLRDIPDWDNRTETGAAGVKLGADGKPLQISDLGRYMKIVGEPTKGLTFHTYQAAIEKTLDSPVGVRVAWRERTGKTGEKDAKGKDVYNKSWLKTKDFKVGEDAAGKPIYSPTVKGFLEEHTSPRGTKYFTFTKDDNGIEFKAQAYVEYFQKIPA